MARQAACTGPLLHTARMDAALVKQGASETSSKDSAGFRSDEAAGLSGQSSNVSDANNMNMILAQLYHGVPHASLKL